MFKIPLMKQICTTYMICAISLFPGNGRQFELYYHFQAINGSHLTIFQESDRYDTKHISISKAYSKKFKFLNGTFYTPCHNPFHSFVEVVVLPERKVFK